MLLRRLGDAVGRAVDVLLLDEDSKEIRQSEKTLRERKTEAMQCMAYVRDVLSRGGEGEIDEKQLIKVDGYNSQRRDTNIERTSSIEDIQPPPSNLVRRAASSETISHTTVGKPRSALTTTESATPVLSFTKTTPHPPIGVTLPIRPLTSFSSRANQTPQPRLKPVPNKATRSGPKKVLPWGQTPSTYSSDSPYAGESSHRFPSPSTTPSHKVADPPISPLPNTAEAPPESPQADPLGVLG